mmetsp:Transcript_9443/g.35079  ORF Transcript_9443/g.35079 Transcript_9443/m.35079 type:complete len:85 (-) Transcript_9443:482-736(-)
MLHTIVLLEHVNANSEFIPAANFGTIHIPLSIQHEYPRCNILYTPSNAFLKSLACLSRACHDMKMTPLVMFWIAQSQNLGNFIF